jgi:putative ATP-binding cassette transporter
MGAADFERTAGQAQAVMPFLRCAAGFWSGPTRGRAAALTILVIGLIVAQMAIQVLWTDWNRWFYDALQERSLSGIMATLPWLPCIVVGFIVAVTGLLVCRMFLQLAWRSFVTRRITGQWLSDQRYYRLALGTGGDGAPEQRIAEGARLAIETLVELGIGFLTSVLGALAFASVLWTVGGAARIEMAGVEVVVPGYMAFVAIGYAGLVTAATWRAGRPLSRRIAAKNEAEARFRAELTRLRENAESIALHRGDGAEHAAMTRRFAAVAAAWRDVIGRSGIVAVGTNANIALSPLVPLLFATPKFLAGGLSLGEVMQIAAAFAVTQTALVWFNENTARISDLMASVHRVSFLLEAIEACKTTTDALTTIRTADCAIRVENLTLWLPDGRVLTDRLTLAIAPGERVLIKGPSGTGKSTLIRAMAGLWPWRSGLVVVPEDARIAFVPQRAYLPNGKLRDAVLYGTRIEGISDARLAAALRRCGLNDLAGRLDEEGRWDMILSGGEKQRIGFARLLLGKYAAVMLDEATSALDEASEGLVMALFDQELAGVTVVSVGHRSSLGAFHSRHITLQPARSNGGHGDPPSLGSAGEFPALAMAAG